MCQKWFSHAKKKKQTAKRYSMTSYVINKLNTKNKNFKLF